MPDGPRAPHPGLGLLLGLAALLLGARVSRPCWSCGRRGALPPG
jgi:hypothetical protein